MAHEVLRTQAGGGALGRVERRHRGRPGELLPGPARLERRAGGGGRWEAGRQDPGLLPRASSCLLDLLDPEVPPEVPLHLVGGG